MDSVNRGSATDVHGVTIEHFLHGGEVLLQKMTEIIHCIQDRQG